MDPVTTVGAGLAIVGSKDILTRLLGPTADYVGGEIQGFVKKCNINIDQIFRRAIRKLGSDIDKPGAVNPRIVRHVLDEGRFCEDEISREYYAGVLAASRTDDGEDDRGVAYLSALRSMSRYQLRLHYIIYASIKRVFESQRIVFNPLRPEGAKKLRICFRFREILSSLEIEGSAPSTLPHAALGLERLGLVSWLRWGERGDLAGRGYSRVRWSAFMAGPSGFGVELMLWANGTPDVRPQDYLFDSISVKVLPEIELPTNAVPVSEVLTLSSNADKSQVQSLARSQSLVSENVFAEPLPPKDR